MTALTKSEALAARSVPALTAALRAELRKGAANIPAELKRHKAWLCWRAPEIAAGTGKVKKVPLYPVSRGNRRGEQGCPDDLRNLGTWTEAAKAFNEDETIAGVGFAMLPDFGIVAFDGDHCVVDGAIRADAAKLAALTYCEISPSDTGIRAMWLGRASDGKNHADGFELFHAKGFVTITGNQVPNAYQASGADALPALDAGLGAELEKLSRPAGAQAGKVADRAPPAPDDDLGRSVTLAAVTADTIVELTSALEGMSAFRADDRGSWIEVLQALASLKGTGFDADAHQLARDFSERSTKFDLGDFALKWDGMSPTRITYKSIFAWATADGWENPRAGVPVSQVATADSVSRAAITARRFPRQSMAEFISRKPPAWRIKGLLPNDGVAVIYGASGSGKSFFCIDLSMAIAQGRAWRGQATKQGDVVYVCAEGARDFANRMAAYSKHNGDGPCEVIDAAPNLLIKADVEALIAELMLAPVAVVFLDTLACLSVGGDENSAKDMGILLDHCKLISRITGALVILVHHTGKNGEGPRGSSALIGAVDVSIEISRSGDDRTARVAKQKGGPDGQEFGFKLITVACGQDEDGEDIESCVLEHTVAVPKAKRKQELKGSNQAIVMRTLQRAFDLTGEGLFVNDLAEAAANELVCDPKAKRDTRRQNCLAAVNSLIAGNRLVEENGLLVPA